MSEGQKRLGLRGLIAAKVVCCGAMIFFLAGGAVGGLGTWLLDGGWLPIAAAVAATWALVHWRRRLRGN